MASRPASTRAYRPPESESGVLAKVVALFLGILVAVLALLALMLWVDARDARDSAGASAAPHGDHNTALPLNSFAGQVPENAQELAAERTATNAAMPALPAGDVVKVQMTLKDMTVEIAPGIKYNTWAFDGHGAPGPVVHVREGQTVEMTLTNGAPSRTRSTSTQPGSPPTGHFAMRCPASPSRSGSRQGILASTCTTAARSRCSPTLPTACTARSSSSRRRASRRSTTSTSSSAVSGT